MFTFTRFLTFVGLAVVFITPAFADELANTFEEAAARGDAQEAGFSTKDYFMETLLPYYGRKYPPVIQSCLAADSGKGNIPLSFVAAIGADGRVVRVFGKRESPMFVCMRDALRADLFPKPPVSPYYLHIEMNFAGGEASEHRSGEQTLPLVRESDKYSYTFGVPKNWEYDFDQAQDRGARLAFFPNGGSFEKSDSVIYVNEFYQLCRANCIGAASRAISRTLRESRTESPSLQVTVETPLRTEDGGKAEIRILKGGRDPRRENAEAKDKEALAFIEHKETVIVVVLTARDIKTWPQDYAAFQEVVAGHKFFNCDSPGLAVPCRK